MNHVCLMGRLTAEPELRHTQTGKDVLSFTMAVDRGYGDKKATDFFPVLHGNIQHDLSISISEKAA